jgi:hypothetical protein
MGFAQDQYCTTVLAVLLKASSGLTALISDNLPHVDSLLEPSPKVLKRAINKVTTAAVWGYQPDQGLGR